MTDAVKCYIFPKVFQTQKCPETFCLMGALFNIIHSSFLILHYCTPDSQIYFSNYIRFQPPSHTYYTYYKSVSKLMFVLLLTPNK